MAAARFRRDLELGRPELVHEPGEQAFFLGRAGATRLGQMGADAGLTGEASPLRPARSYAKLSRPRGSMPTRAAAPSRGACTGG